MINSLIFKQAFLHKSLELKQDKTNKNTYKLLACISSRPWKDVMVLAASAQGDPFVPLETYPLLWYSTVLSDSGVGGGLGPLPAPRGSDSRII